LHKSDSLSFDRLIDFPLSLGESPVWDSDRQLLWFVDSLRPALFSLDPATRAVTAYEMPATIGSAGLTVDGRLVVALRTGVHLFDPGTRQLDFLVHPEPDVPVNRLNDGKVGPDGCFWVGSMHEAKPRQPTGALYRVTPTGEVTKIASDLLVSNGLAWSPDGRIMYHADTGLPSVAAYDFDPDCGAVGGRHVIAAPDGKAEGLPDGAATDVEGFYWSAGVSAGRLNRISPEGRIVTSITVPMTAPTMPCFGGQDMRTMFLTSLTRGEAPNSAGTLISCRVGVPGVPVARFG
jgi:sugar lactone lactonase YvrE